MRRGIHGNLWYRVLGKYKNLVLKVFSALPFHPEGFPDSQLIKNLPAMQETWVRFLAWEDPLEKGKSTHSSILAWRIPIHGVTKSWTQLSDFHFHPQPLVFVFHAKLFCVFWQFQRKLRVKEEQGEYNLIIPEDSANNIFLGKIMCVLYKYISLQ